MPVHSFRRMMSASCDCGHDSRSSKGHKRVLILKRDCQRVLRGGPGVVPYTRGAAKHFRGCSPHTRG